MGKCKFSPEEEFADGAPPIVIEEAGLEDATSVWDPFFRHSCTFDPSQFKDVMMNHIKNPNINSSWLFRADILYEHEGGRPDVPQDIRHSKAMPAFQGLEYTSLLVRRLIPRNALRDEPLDQTCVTYESTAGQTPQETLIVYIPHVSSPSEMPFYHPRVRGIAFLHEWSPTAAQGHVSISYLMFDRSDRSDIKLMRTALQLLLVLHKHGQGRAGGYVKRVHHDSLIPQDTFQNRYTVLKQKYAKKLILSWAETTDPVKHVFEDLGIAAFLIELWAQMYHGQPFPGFVDIGCGNGLLVYLLNEEGYKGWGFDARTRKSWQAYSTSLLDSDEGEPKATLQQLVLLPSLVGGERGQLHEEQIHDGEFPKGTFIVSNHADELTPWTPILATISECPFIMIPCCSHNLTGSRYRAPPPKDKSKGRSAYASLVEWVEGIAWDCGWEVETEMLRIPSTRNTALVGRTRVVPFDGGTDIEKVLHKYGGTAGYYDAVLKLVGTAKEH